MCQDLILNVYKNSTKRFFFSCREKKINSFQQLTFWQLIKSLIYEQFCLIKRVWASVNSLQFPTVELFSQVYPIIKKKISIHSIAISTMITEKQKKHKKKTDRNCWYAWALYNLSFLRMEKQRLRISAALTLQHIKFL